MTDKKLEVILTHEHTDFDALASLLGASIAFPEAIPVLPRRLNRNVDEFLVLYKDQLPFAVDNDLPKVKVVHAVLVDTQSANWVKGMDQDTKLTIIDHHGDDKPVSSDNDLDTEVGANTTLFVEQLIKDKYAPSPVEATLLALGIHEDTGSLTYPSTTYRDARSLAWLMEPKHNVNQEVLLHFLNHPLSTAQRELLHTLIDNSEFLDISGHQVVIAQAQARGFREELSALASRLRDFHETDAVFIAVNLGDIIQLVARSTTDNIDVGEIASALGGGGHARAAAAPIQVHGVNTQAIRDRLVELITDSAKTIQTVGQIMSVGRPQTVPPTMVASAAAELMSRYGHEGFPVVLARADGSEELLGILTRRQIDRAMNHGLGDQPVSRFMRSGHVTVRPEDSVTTLRRQMVENNWGQVPVVDQQERIIGIVTRTDLIKLWDDPTLPSHHSREIEQRLRARLEPAQYALLRLIGSEVDKLNYSVYVVGGFVRDLLLDQQKPFLYQEPDVDIVVEGDAIALALHMRDLYGGRVVPHKRFNTAKWLLSDADSPINMDLLLSHLVELDQHADGLSELPTHLDFVTARTEFYTAPTVLPTVELSSIKLDLHRRDFTINTLAVCLNPSRWGELLDFYGGLNDLRNENIRVLHSLSFVDDPTRILRAVRYEQRFGFTIGPRTMELLLDAVPLLDRVSGTRIRHELERILLEELPELSLLRLTEFGVLQCLHPELVADDWICPRFERLRAARSAAESDSELAGEPLDHLLWGILTFRLSPDAHESLNDRLGLRGAVKQLTRDLSIIQSHIDDLNRSDLLPSEIVGMLERCSPLSVKIAQIACFDLPTVVESLNRYVTSLRNAKPSIDGNTLFEMDIPRGPLYSQILRVVRNALVDGLIHGREQEIALAASVAREDASPSTAAIGMKQEKL